MTVFVPVDDPLKISLLKLRNESKQVRRLTVAYYVEWVLGTHRDVTAPHVITGLDPETGGVLARNPFHANGKSQVAFVYTDLLPRTVTGDRTEFLGRNGSLAKPHSFGRVALSGRMKVSKS